MDNRLIRACTIAFDTMLANSGIAEVIRQLILLFIYE
jgi:hypothetical protein